MGEAPEHASEALLPAQAAQSARKAPSRPAPSVEAPSP